MGDDKHSLIISKPCWNESDSSNGESPNVSCILSSAIPPPSTIPYSIAARVACNASSTLSFFSFNSTSEPAPI